MIGPTSERKDVVNVEKLYLIIKIFFSSIILIIRKKRLSKIRIEHEKLQKELDFRNEISRILGKK